jgi:3-deoxy-D-manno-octulosonic-acid transferase
VPRHPPRGAAVAQEATASGIPVARRAAGEDPAPGTEVYVADTLGELGLFYRLAGVAVVGGSLVPHGGQNPLEPARLGCPILLGPHTWNFADVVARLVPAGGAVPLGPERDLAVALAVAAERVLSNPIGARGMTQVAAALADDAAGLPGRVADALLALLLPATTSITARGGGKETGGTG